MDARVRGPRPRQAAIDGGGSRFGHRYFPAARGIEAALFPSLGEVTTTFGVAGFRYVSLDHVQIQLALSLGYYIARLRLRAISTFERMTDEQIAAGFAALEADVAAERQPRPVVETTTLLVLAL